MDKRYLMLRNKMERFNAWEAMERNKISEADRLKQFLILYDLGKLHDKNVLKQTHDRHLEGLIGISERLRAAQNKSKNITGSKLFF